MNYIKKWRENEKAHTNSYKRDKYVYYFKYLKGVIKMPGQTGDTP